MPQPETLNTQNLILAAMLIEAGARMVRVEPGDRFSTVVLDPRRLSMERFTEDMEEFLGNIEGGDDWATERWETEFETSPMGRIAVEYLQLKKICSRRRAGRR